MRLSGNRGPDACVCENVQAFSHLPRLRPGFLSSRSARLPRAHDGRMIDLAALDREQRPGPARDGNRPAGRERLGWAHLALAARLACHDDAGLGHYRGRLAVTIMWQARIWSATPRTPGGARIAAERTIGRQARGVTALAMACGPSVDWCGYWQRAMN